MNPLIAISLVMYFSGAYIGAMGEEHFGNEPLPLTNYTSWPGVEPMVNVTERVYHQWVNGNENFYYRGTIDDVNTALKSFARIKSDDLEVVLRPGPGIATTFSPKKTVPFNWNLHLLGGIAAHMSTLDQGDQIWSTHPVLNIYIDQPTDLDKIQIPRDLKVTELAGLKQRALKCLTSSDQTVRGWSCGYLAGLDRFDPKVMNRIAEMLDDDDNWVRLNAAGSLASFGAVAKPSISNLEKLAESEDDQLRTRAQQTLAKINAAKADEKAESRHRALLDAIGTFCKKRD